MVNTGKLDEYQEPEIWEFFKNNKLKEKEKIQDYLKVLKEY